MCVCVCVRVRVGGGGGGSILIACPKINAATTVREPKFSEEPEFGTPNHY